MSPWLFNLFIEAMMKEVREKAGDIYVTLRDERRNIEWKVGWLMFADDTVLLSDSEEEWRDYYKNLEECLEGENCRGMRMKIR